MENGTGAAHGANILREMAGASARAAARRAARKSVEHLRPGLKVRGISTFYLEDSIFLVSVDAGGDLIALIARPYFDDDGSPYWRADPPSQGEAALLGFFWYAKKTARNAVIEEQANQPDR